MSEIQSQSIYEVGAKVERAIIYFSKAELEIMELCLRMARDTGLVGMITQHQWMFLSSFEKLRLVLLNSITINSMVHLGPRAFEEIGGEVVQNTMFSLRKVNIKEYRPTFIRLIGMIGMIRCTGTI